MCLNQIKQMYQKNLLHSQGHSRFLASVKIMSFQTAKTPIGLLHGQGKGIGVTADN